jgi:hypothetical protein
MALLWVLVSAKTTPFYSFVDRDMVMRYRGGGVGHTSTREATDWFLKDRDLLDAESKQARAADSHNTPMDADQGDGEGEGERGSEQDENEDEAVNENEEIKEDEIDEEMDYGYILDEEELDGSEEEDPPGPEGELADDALGAEDGEEVEDELDNLGYGAL